MKSRKQKPQWAARKKAFDSVMTAYRQAKDTGLGTASIDGGGKGVSNPVRPSLTDFRCDCEKIFNKVVTAQDMVVRFRACYINYDSESSIDNERYADKVIGSGRHAIEQGCGNLFLKNGLFPLHGRGGYFTTIRQPRGSV
jgi:hypothetical protein